MIDDLSDLRKLPLLKDIHFEWTPEIVEQFSYAYQSDASESGNGQSHINKGYYFAIEVFRNMIALALRKVDTGSDHQITQKDVGRFFNPVLIVMMTKAIKRKHVPSDEHSYYSISDEIREYIKHKLNI